VSRLLSTPRAIPRLEDDTGNDAVKWQLRVRLAHGRDHRREVEIIVFTARYGGARRVPRVLRRLRGWVGMRIQIMRFC
jgi:hypothetical protein